MAVNVSREVLDGLEAVRQSGEVNMFDRSGVVRVAWELGYYAAGNWAFEHKNEYAEGVFNGFEAE